MAFKKLTEPHPDPRLRVAIYIRVSTNHQIDRDSLPLQRRTDKLCEICPDIEDYEVFEDAGFSEHAI